MIIEETKILRTNVMKINNAPYFYPEVEKSTIYFNNDKIIEAVESDKGVIILFDDGMKKRYKRFENSDKFQYKIKEINNYE